MAQYKLHDAVNVSDDDLNFVYQLLPAEQGTYVVFASNDGSLDKRPVIAWGVHADCSLSPITKSGVWDGVANNNVFVLYPDGKASGLFEEDWENIAQATEAVKNLEP
jgi:hypothetical protein